MGYGGVNVEERAVHLVTGDRVLMEFSTFGDRFPSVVADVRDDGRLMVYAPIPSLVTKRLGTDANAWVRYAFEGRLVGFSTRVLNREIAVGAVLELAPPREVVDAEERAEPRCPCRFPAEVAVDGRTLRAVVEDMSRTCARVRFPDGGWSGDGAPGGRSVRLTFRPFARDPVYSLACEARMSFLRNREWRAVLAYGSAEAETRRRIEEFVEAQLECGLPRL